MEDFIDVHEIATEVSNLAHHQYPDLQWLCRRKASVATAVPVISWMHQQKVAVAIIVPLISWMHLSRISSCSILAQNYRGNNSITFLTFLILRVTARCIFKMHVYQDINNKRIQLNNTCCHSNTTVYTPRGGI